MIIIKKKKYRVMLCVLISNDVLDIKGVYRKRVEACKDVPLSMQNGAKWKLTPLVKFPITPKAIINYQLAISQATLLSCGGYHIHRTPLNLP